MSPQRAEEVKKVNATTMVHTSVWTLRRYPDLGQRTDRHGVTIALAAAVEVEASLSTESPGHIRSAPRMEGRVEGALRKQGDTGTEALTEVQKQQSRTELLMAAKGGQEETAIATKWTGRGKEHASTGESKLHLSSQS